MGIFDSLGGALGSAIGQQGANALEGLMGQAGGLTGIVGLLNQAGLGEQVNSWLGKGDNMPLTAAEVTAALGDQHLQQVAGLLGLPVGQIAQHLAQTLPAAVDAASPDGTLNDPAGSGGSGY